MKNSKVKLILLSFINIICILLILRFMKQDYIKVIKDFSVIANTLKDVPMCKSDKRTDIMVLFEQNKLTHINKNINVKTVTVSLISKINKNENSNYVVKNEHNIQKEIMKIMEECELKLQSINFNTHSNSIQQEYEKYNNEAITIIENCFVNIFTAANEYRNSTSFGIFAIRKKYEIERIIDNAQLSGEAYKYTNIYIELCHWFCEGLKDFNVIE